MGSASKAATTAFSSHQQSSRLAHFRYTSLSAFRSHQTTASQPREPVEVIRHKWSPKGILKQIAVLILFLLIPFVFILFVYAFARSVVFPPDYMACSSYQSPPHTRNRTVSKQLCVAHRSNDAQLIKESLVATNNASLTFLVLGDFGRDGYCCQRDVAIEMDKIGQSIQAKFVLNSGDSFYEDGIDAVTDEEVQTSFTDVYNQPYLRELDWWGVLGNHDYRGSTEALMNLSRTVEPRFLMDARWWSRQIKRGTENKDVRFIMIDTSPMISNYRTEDPDMRGHPDGIDTQFARVEEQMRWLERELQYPNEIKIVMGHHPAFSYMDYGTENRTFLETRVTELLERYNTLAYFAGHDHNLQFARPRPTSTSYFVSGAGSRLRDGFVKAKPGDIHFFHVVHGFLACSLLETDVLKVAAVDMYGKMVDLVSVP